MEIRVGRNFRIIKRLGCGSFGEIWHGVDVITGHEVAIKLEHLKVPAPHLLTETKINKILEGINGIPRVHWYGCQGDYVVLVMDLLGPSIEDLFSYCGRKLSLSTVSMIGSQMIDRLESCHALGVIHRDIKPHNFLMGKNQTEKMLYVIDFGLAKPFKESGTGNHIPYKEGKQLTGTARFTSVSTHIGVEQSRRDDLESVGYVLLYLLKGSLPWQGLKAANKKEKYERISTTKICTPLDILCKGYPEALQNYISYCRGLKFVQRPDYDWLRDCIRSMFYYDPVILSACGIKDPSSIPFGAIADMELELQTRATADLDAEYEEFTQEEEKNQIDEIVNRADGIAYESRVDDLGQGNEIQKDGSIKNTATTRTTEGGEIKTEIDGEILANRNENVLIAINSCSMYDWIRSWRIRVQKLNSDANNTSFNNKKNSEKTAG